MNYPRKIFEKENHSEVSNSRDAIKLDRFKSHVFLNVIYFI